MLGASKGTKNRNHITIHHQPTDMFCIGGLKFHMTTENRCAT